MKNKNAMFLVCLGMFSLCLTSCGSYKEITKEEGLTKLNEISTFCKDKKDERVKVSARLLNVFSNYSDDNKITYDSYFSYDPSNYRYDSYSIVENTTDEKGALVTQQAMWLDGDKVYLFNTRECYKSEVKENSYLTAYDAKDKDKLLNYILNHNYTFFNPYDYTYGTSEMLKNNATDAKIDQKYYRDDNGSYRVTFTSEGVTSVYNPNTSKSESKPLIESGEMIFTNNALANGNSLEKTDNKVTREGHLTIRFDGEFTYHFPSINDFDVQPGQI